MCFFPTVFGAKPYFAEMTFMWQWALHISLMLINTALSYESIPTDQADVWSFFSYIALSCIRFHLCMIGRCCRREWLHEFWLGESRSILLHLFPFLSFKLYLFRAH